MLDLKKRTRGRGGHLHFDHEREVLVFETGHNAPILEFKVVPDDKDKVVQFLNWIAYSRVDVKNSPGSID